MSKPKIVTCYPLTGELVSQIRSTAGDHYEVVVSSQEKIAEDIFAAEIFCGHAKVPVDWPGVTQQGHLQWIQSSAAGLDHCLVPEVIRSNIIVSGCSALFANQVAEQALALLTALIRRLPDFFRAQQRREFVRRPTDDLLGKSIGIIGFGGNGQRIAKVLRPLVGQIMATDVFHEQCQQAVHDGVADQVLPADQLDALLGQSDVVIVTLPLTAENENRIGEEQFQQIKTGAYLINVGRGSVVNTSSLIQSLSQGHLAGAGLDVVEPEPLPEDSALWDMENVIITPHVGAQSAHRIPATTDLFCENLARFRAGQHLLNLVDKQLGFPRPEHRIQF
jgi:phosphoglycerate dehydrogenase-like enzyme